MFCSAIRLYRSFRGICPLIVAGAVSLPGCAFDRASNGPITKMACRVWPVQPSKAEELTERPIATGGSVAPAGEAVASDRPALCTPQSSCRAAGPNDGGEAPFLPPTISASLPSYPAIAADRSTSDVANRGSILSSPKPPTQVAAQQTAPPAAPAAARTVSAGQRFVPPQPRIARAATTGIVLHVNEDTFDEQVLTSDVPVLVNFFAKWCGPCRMLGPSLEELAREIPQVKIVKIDVDDNPGLAARYGVSSLPSLLVFKDGKMTARQKGLVPKSRLMAMLDLSSNATFR